ncbi:hypothetical protein [Sphingorhabdus sp.]|uniref:hypothetical protein n=1 Tax=Sphingorhabdus sp. TaxID=1902408 RepID=UPI0033409D0C
MRKQKITLEIISSVGIDPPQEWKWTELLDLEPTESVRVIAFSKITEVPDVIESNNDEN